MSIKQPISHCIAFFVLCTVAGNAKTVTVPAARADCIALPDSLLNETRLTRQGVSFDGTGLDTGIVEFGGTRWRIAGIDGKPSALMLKGAGSPSITGRS